MPDATKDNITRRIFIQETGAIAAGLATAGSVVTRTAAEAAEPGSSFASHWDQANDRVWLGEEYWANPLQDWQVVSGRIECIKAAPNRNVHLLTRQLAEHPGDLQMSVRIGRVGGGPLEDGKGSAGFRIGAIGAGFIMADVHLASYKQAGFPVVAIASRTPAHAKTVELASFNTAHPNLVFPLDRIDWMARIVWASQ